MEAVESKDRTSRVVKATVLFDFLLFLFSSMGRTREIDFMRLLLHPARIAHYSAFHSILLICFYFPLWLFSSRTKSATTQRKKSNITGVTVFLCVCVLLARTRKGQNLKWNGLKSVYIFLQTVFEVLEPSQKRASRTCTHCLCPAYVWAIRYYST